LYAASLGLTTTDVDLTSRLAHDRVMHRPTAPASEQDSVMEYGLNRSATRIELSRHVDIARTYMRQVGNQICNQVCDQVCDLDSVMEFSLKQVADKLASQLAS